MPVVYVVVPTNFEYNDEVYYAAGLDKPIKAYKSKQKADEACTELNFGRVKELIKYEGLRSYGYGIVEVVNSKVLYEVFQSDDFDRDFDFSSLNDEQLHKIADGLANPFYSVYEVERE